MVKNKQETQIDFNFLQESTLNFLKLNPGNEYAHLSFPCICNPTNLCSRNCPGFDSISSVHITSILMENLAEEGANYLTQDIHKAREKFIEGLRTEFNKCESCPQNHE